MPRCSRSPDAGQASAEYVGVVALVAIVLSGAATAVAAPDLPGKLARTIRQGICLVAGDVCTSDDARARGLAPCVTASDETERAAGVSVGLIRIGSHRRLLIEHRSDGRVRVSYDHGPDVAGTAGAGVSLGSHFELGADGSVKVGFRPGRAWELPEAEFRRLMARIPEGDDPEERLPDLLGDPQARYKGLDVDREGEVGLSVSGVTLKAAEASMSNAIGVRSGAGGRTLVYRRKLRGGLLPDVLPGLRDGDEVVLEWRKADPDELVLRSARIGSRASTETVARLRLDQPGDSWAAAKFVADGTSVAPLLAGDLNRRIKARGMVERYAYTEEEESDGGEYGAKLGIGAAVDRTRSVRRRRLVSAEALIGGERIERTDCLDLL